MPTHSIFFIARLYPYIAIPLALICIELGVFFRRQKNQAQYLCFVITGVLILSSLLWLVFRGDLNSDQWVRAFLGS